MKFVQKLIKEYTFSLFIPILLSVLISLMGIFLDNVTDFYPCLRYLADCLVPSFVLASLSFLVNHFDSKIFDLKQYFLIFSVSALVVAYIIYRIKSDTLFAVILFLIILFFNVVAINIQFFESDRDSGSKKHTKYC